MTVFKLIKFDDLLMIEKENERLEALYQDCYLANKDLLADNKRLKKENEQLKAENAQVTGKIGQLEEENANLADELDTSRKNFNVVNESAKRLACYLDTLNAENTKLKAQLQNHDKSSQVEHCEERDAKLDDKPARKPQEILVYECINKLFDRVGKLEKEVFKAVETQTAFDSERFKPHKCPVCKGLSRIYENISNEAKGLLGKQDNNGNWYITCIVCNGTGIFSEPKW